MKSLGAFFSLIRWPNLVFIVLTQCLFYFIVFPYCTEVVLTREINFYFLMLVLASVVISAAGYIINDYFDVQIDAINKPARVIVGKVIKRRWAIVWHLSLSLIGFAMSVYVSIETSAWVIAFANLVCIILLWLYSVKFKKSLLVGNIIIAALTAWVIFVIYFFAASYSRDSLVSSSGLIKFFRYTVLFSGFAFIVTIIREVIKDMEDVEGDRKYKSSTMPIAWGIPASKVFTGVWIVVCAGMLSAVSVYAFYISLWYMSIYIVLLLVFPLCWLLMKLKSANVPSDYHRMSTQVKFIMLAGIISMCFSLFV